MRAAVVGDRRVQVRDVPAPRPKANEILVQVRAASLNRADLAVAAGHQHGPMGGPGTIPGLEWAGEVAEVGTEVEGLRLGDRVMCSGGGRICRVRNHRLWTGLANSGGHVV
jgi:NADPH2:quinone reductase